MVLTSLQEYDTVERNARNISVLAAKVRRERIHPIRALQEGGIKLTNGTVNAFMSRCIHETLLLNMARTLRRGQHSQIESAVFRETVRTYRKTSALMHLERTVNPLIPKPMLPTIPRPLSSEEEYINNILGTHMSQNFIFLSHLHRNQETYFPVEGTMLYLRKA